jgi:DNA-binding beta-propeller fold protein YncE
MAYVVDWAISPVPELTLVREEVTVDDQLAPRLGGVCVTADGAVVVTEPGADRARWDEPGGPSVFFGGPPGLVDGPAGTARFRRPLGVAAGPDGSVLVADTDNHAVRRIDIDGQVATLAGGLYGAVDGPGAQARFRHPQGLAVAPDGTVFVADTVSNTVRRIDGEGMVTTFAGGPYSQGDVEAGPLAFRRPEAVAIGADGTVYVADTGNDRVCSIDVRGRAHLVAGRRRPGQPAAPAPDLRWPTSLALAEDGAVYVSDAANNVVRRIGTDGTATVLPGDPVWQPVALCLSPEGHLVVAEAHWSPRRTTGRLRRVAVTSTVQRQKLSSYADRL